MLLKQKGPSLPRNLGPKTFGKLPVAFSIKVNLLKNCEPDLSYIIAELFNKCWKESAW